MKIIQFTVPGRPVPWSRARQNGKRFYTDSKVQAHKDKIAAACRAEMLSQGIDAPLSGALHLSMMFNMGNDGSTEILIVDRDDGKNPHTSRPDIDNLVKIIDALNGVAWHDDAQVSFLSAQKMAPPKVAHKMRSTKK